MTNRPMQFQTPKSIAAALSLYTGVTGPKVNVIDKCEKDTASLLLKL